MYVTGFPGTSAGVWTDNRACVPMWTEFIYSSLPPKKDRSTIWRNGKDYQHREKKTCLISALKKQRQKDLCEFQASQSCIVAHAIYGMKTITAKLTAKLHFLRGQSSE